MSRWFPLEAAEADIFTSAPQLYRFPVRLPVPPSRVWESLQSDESLAAWGLGVQKLTWTAPRPFGIGTTREVVLPLRAMTVHERFFRWDEGAGYSFYVYEADRPFFRRFAENYEIEADGSGSIFTWTIALEPKPRLAKIMRLTVPVNRFAFGQVANSARKYFAKNP